MTQGPRITDAFTRVAVAGTHATVRFDEVAAGVRRFTQEVKRAFADEPLVRMAVWRRWVGRS